MPALNLGGELGTSVPEARRRSQPELNVTSAGHVTSGAPRGGLTISYNICTPHETPRPIEELVGSSPRLLSGRQFAICTPRVPEKEFAINTPRVPGREEANVQAQFRIFTPRTAVTPRCDPDATGTSWLVGPFDRPVMDAEALNQLHAADALAMDTSLADSRTPRRFPVIAEVQTPQGGHAEVGEAEVYTVTVTLPNPADEPELSAQLLSIAAQAVVSPRPAPGFWAYFTDNMLCCAGHRVHGSVRRHKDKGAASDYAQILPGG